MVYAPGKVFNIESHLYSARYNGTKIPWHFFNLKHGDEFDPSSYVDFFFKRYEPNDLIASLQAICIPENCKEAKKTFYCNFGDLKELDNNTPNLKMKERLSKFDDKPTHHECQYLGLLSAEDSILKYKFPVVSSFLKTERQFKVTFSKITPVYKDMILPHKVKSVEILSDEFLFYQQDPRCVKSLPHSNYLIKYKIGDNVVSAKPFWQNNKTKTMNFRDEMHGWWLTKKEFLQTLEYDPTKNMENVESYFYDDVARKETIAIRPHVRTLIKDIIDETRDEKIVLPSYKTRINEFYL